MAIVDISKYKTFFIIVELTVVLRRRAFDDSFENQFTKTQTKFKTEATCTVVLKTGLYCYLYELIFFMVNVLNKTGNTKIKKHIKTRSTLDESGLHL